MITVLMAAGFAIVLLAGLFWTLQPMLAPPQGLHPTNWAAADLILDRTVFCVVNPRSIIPRRDDFDVHFQWAAAEIKARGLIVILPWSLAVGAVVWSRRRKKKANQASEAIAPQGRAQPQR